MSDRARFYLKIIGRVLQFAIVGGAIVLLYDFSQTLTVWIFFDVSLGIIGGILVSVSAIDWLIDR